MILCSATTGLRVTEIANFEVSMTTSSIGSKRGTLIGGDLSKYRGLKPDGKVFLTETGRKFAMSIKKRLKTEDGKEVTIEYKACDVLERAFKRFYKRAFGEETDFNSHSGRKYFACQLANILDRKAEEHEFYDDVVELMRSQNLTAIQPYLMPTKAEIIGISKTML